MRSENTLLIQAKIKNKLLVVCGPTSTGKTSLSLKIAGSFGGEIVSADSRQVYKFMNIGTGKDIPKGARLVKKNKFGYYMIEGVRVWGYDLADPREGFNVASYVYFARQIIKDIWKRKKLPILVGGSGLYIKSLVDGLNTAFIPVNKRLRKNLQGKDRKVLFEHLALLDPIKAASLNQSDRNNPSRLIRAIEIATYIVKKKRNLMGIKGLKEEADILFVGLFAPRDFLAKRIKERVKKRVRDGIKEELRNLLSMKIPWSSQALNTIGYKEWRDYFRGLKKEKDVIKEWERDEISYSKRQMIWFKKDKRIVWFDIKEKDFVQKVENLVKKWYKT